MVAGLTGICEALGESIPIPGRSDGSKIGCVDTDTVPDSIAGESLLFGCPVGFVVLPGIDGVAGFRPGFAAERNRRLGLPFTSNGDRPALRGFGAIPDCAALRGRVLSSPDLLS